MHACVPRCITCFSTDIESTMPLPPGLYCPTVTFFLPTRAQELDIPAHKRHVQFLARAGMDGVVVQGSTAEAVALTPEERKIVSTALPWLDGFLTEGD